MRIRCGPLDSDEEAWPSLESKLTCGELGRLQKEPVKGCHDEEVQEALGSQPSADIKSAVTSSKQRTAVWELTVCRWHLKC